MKKIFKFLTILFFGYWGLTQIISCSQDNESNLIKSQSSIRTGDGNSSNGDGNDSIIIKRKKLTEIISFVVCSKPILKKVIKDAAVAQNLAGYYETEMFFNLEKDKARSDLNGNSIAQFLMHNAPQFDVQGTIAYLCGNDPGLAILVEGNVNGSNVSNSIYYDDGFDEKNPNAIAKGYNCGNQCQIEILSGNSSSESILIVRESEGYSLKYPGEADVMTLGTACGNQIIVYGDINTNVDTIAGNRTGDCNEGQTPDRDLLSGNENLHRFKTTRDFDPFKGKGEFLISAIHGSGVKYETSPTGQIIFSGDPLKYVKKRVTGVKDDFQWKVINADFFLWNPKTEGDNYKVVWYEDDGGSKINKEVEINLQINKIKVGLKLDIINWFTTEDQFIGEAEVYYCEPILYNHTPTLLDEFIFQCNERIL